MNNRLNFSAEPLRAFTNHESNNGEISKVNLGDWRQIFTAPILPGPAGSAAPAAPLPKSIQKSDQSAWLKTVDSAIRNFYKLTGVGIAGRVRFVTEADYPKQFPKSMLPRLLLNLFLDEPTSRPIASIIRHHKVPVPWVSNHPSVAAKRVADLTKFIAAQIKAGHFDETVVLPVPGPGASTRQVVSRTPGQLAAQMIGGFTISKTSRAGSRIVMPIPNLVETLVHEACHFYAHSKFTSAAERVGDTELFNGLRVSQILHEGFCEYFARQVMQANPTTLGPSEMTAYQGYVKATGLIVATAREKDAREAYFKGSTSAIKRVLASVKANKDAYPLMVPDYAVK